MRNLEVLARETSMLIHREDMWSSRLRFLGVLALLWWPFAAYPDYPAMEGRGILNNSLTFEGLGFDDVSACTARGPQWSWGHAGECGGGGGQVCGFDSDPAVLPVRGWCRSTDLAAGCHASCRVMWCPFGGRNSNGTCINTPPCPDGGPRDPE